MDNMILDILAVVPWWKWVLLSVCWIVAILNLRAPKVHIYVLRALQFMIMGLVVGTFGSTMQKYGLLAPGDSFYTQILAIVPFFSLWIIGHTAGVVLSPPYNAQVDIHKKTVQMQRSLAPMVSGFMLLTVNLFFMYVVFIWPMYIHRFWIYLGVFSYLIVGSFHGLLSAYITRYDKEYRRNKKISQMQRAQLS